MNYNQTTELSVIDFPVERFIKAGYNTIAPMTSSKRNGYSETIYYIISGELEVDVEGVVYNCKENSIIHLSKDEKVVIKNPLSTKKVSLYYILFDLKNIYPKSFELYLNIFYKALTYYNQALIHL